MPHSQQNVVPQREQTMLLQPPARSTSVPQAPLGHFRLFFEMAAREAAYSGLSRSSWAYAAQATLPGACAVVWRKQNCFPQLAHVSSGAASLPPRTSRSQPTPGQKRTLGSLRSMRRRTRRFIISRPASSSSSADKSESKMGNPQPDSKHVKELSPLRNLAFTLSRKQGLCKECAQEHSTKASSLWKLPKHIPHSTLPPALKRSNCVVILPQRSPRGT